MKRLLTITASFAFSFASALAQPVISDSSHVVPIGFGDSVSILNSAVSPGNAGANQTWDFSAMTPTPAGYAKYVSAASTPYVAHFPTATRAVKIDLASGTIYEYDQVSNTKWEQLGNNITGTGGDDYTAGPKTLLPLSFHYNDVVTDTFMKNGSGPYTVTMTYDGYGTLITPFGTNSNVIRVMRSFGGSDYYIEWYSTSPYLYQLLNYDNNTQQYTFTGSATTGVNELAGNDAVITVSPNPFNAIATMHINTMGSLAGMQLMLTDIGGRVVKKLDVNKADITIDREGLQAGLYFYGLYRNDICLNKGKLSIQ